jgi:hypothetical protein
VVGDIHGCLDSFLRVLRLAGLVSEQSRWCGGPGDRLVICGDMVDEGACSKTVLELIRALQQEAGERVTALMGNHELLLLRALATCPRALAWETVWSWAGADRRLQELLTLHSIPRLTTEAVRHSFQQTFLASGSAQYPPDYAAACDAIPEEVAERAAELLEGALRADGTLEWLLGLPVAKKIGEWGFFHGGPPSGFSGGVDDLNDVCSRYLRAGEWQRPLLETWAAPESPIATRRWMDAGEAAVDALLSNFGLEHVAFGHSPGALNGIFGRLDQRWGKVFKADTYFSLGVEGFLEIGDDSVWAVYTGTGRDTFHRVHRDRPPLPNLELLWSATS